MLLLLYGGECVQSGTLVYRELATGLTQLCDGGVMIKCHVIVLSECNTFSGFIIVSIEPPDVSIHLNKIV